MTADPRPDVEIAAEATARELRLWRRPDVDVDAGEHTGERQNLPRPVRPGQTYHHVRAAMRALSRLTARATGRQAGP